MRSEGNRAFFLTVVLVVVGVCAAIEGLGLRIPRHLRRYPELADLDPRVVDAVRTRMPKRLGGDVDTHFTYHPLLGAMLAGGETGSLALLRVAMDHRAKRARFERRLGYDGGSALGRFLALLRREELNPVLLRMLDDRELDLATRRDAAVALCWSGNDVAIGPLTSRVLDFEEPFVIRREILLRIVKHGGPLPASASRLLYMPFGEMDYLTAAGLALSGEGEAPSLVVEGLRWFGGREGRDERKILARAVRSFVGDDPEFVPLIKEASDYEANGRKLAEAFERWLDAHADSLDTPYERERRAWLDSEEHRRETAVPTVEEILAADEADLDFGVAALALCPIRDEYRGLYLEKLRRLCVGLAKDLEGIDEPEAIIAVLNRVLLSGDLVLNGFVHLTLAGDGGSCLGNTTLYLAVADRLGLPIRGVESPLHVFVRWDDGIYRRNIETTEDGREIDDVEYLSRYTAPRIHSSAVQRGVYLSSLGEKAALSSIPFHRAWVANTFRGFHELALAAVRDGLRLQPDSSYGRVLEAETLFELDLDRDDEVVGILDSEIARNPADESVWTAAGEILQRMGRIEEALERFERAGEVATDRARADVGRTKCLLALGRIEAARAALPSRIPHGFWYERIERDRVAVELLVRSGDPGWRRELACIIHECSEELPFPAGVVRVA